MKLPFAIAALSALAFLCAEISATRGWGGAEIDDGDGEWFRPKSPEERSWPELVGQTGEDAKAQILKDRPDVTVVILPENSPVFKDLNRNRVRVFVDEEGKVVDVPHIG